jgi:hypothetical protein
MFCLLSVVLFNRIVLLIASINIVLGFFFNGRPAGL